MAKRNKKQDQPINGGVHVPEKLTPEQVMQWPESTPEQAETQFPALFAALPVQFAAALMPQDAASRKVLEERARVMAQPVSQQQAGARVQYLCFRLGAVERYGVPYQYLDELLYVNNLAPVPCTPAFVAGVINHRGELLTILDLKEFFRMPAVAAGDEARIIVVKHGDMRTGLLVDGVDGYDDYQDSELSPPLSSEGVSNIAYVLGIHAGNVALLNLEALLDDPAVQVNR